jgi:hypothetical protein
MFTTSAFRGNSDWRRRFANPLRSLLINGPPSRRLAWALALGAAIGLMPLPWGTSVLCLVAALVLRLSPVAVQLANYVVYPLQLLLFLPYVYLGKIWFGGVPALEAEGLSRQMVMAHPFGALASLAAANGAALAAWGVTAVGLTPLFYALAKRFLETVSVATSSRPREEAEFPDLAP